MEFEFSLLLSFGLVVVFGALYSIFRKSTFVSLLFVFIISLSIGMAISSFFIATKIVPSRFFGLVLLIMLFYKVFQAFLGGIIKNKKIYYTFFTVCCFLEAAACIIIGFGAYADAPLLWQVFYALLICFFYSCAQIVLRNKAEKEFWKSAVNAYLLGFVFIIVLVIILIICVLSEDGSLLEVFFGSGDVSTGKKKKKI
ncbi:MAG: hypothetical protein PHE12_03150 [Clostridia bacterium]|nr:hypothetical protein [Clostridia bacterium]